MIREIIAAMLAIVSISKTSFGKVEPANINFEEIRSRLVRPSVMRLPSLAERRGLTSSEEKLFGKRYSGEQNKAIQAAITQFWSVDLLQALAAAGSTSFDGNDDGGPDEWLYRVDVTEDHRGCGLVLGRPEDRVQLTFLSSEGFKKIEDSQELVGASGRDLFAGVPVADFCERKPGSRVPVDYSIRFSPWDIASHLASSSRLEAALVNLILKPDGLDTDEDLVDVNASDQAEDPGHEHPWRDALHQFDPVIKKGGLSLSDLASSIRRNASIEQSVRSLILAAAVSAPILRKNCDQLKGTWTELRWTNNEWLELFACRSLNQSQVGYVLAVKDGDFADEDVVLSTVSGTLRIEARLNRQTDEFSVRYFDSVKSINSEIWFTKDGQVRAARDSASNSGRHVFFDKSGQLLWINQLTDAKRLRNILWYLNGSPKAFILTDDDGRLVGKGGFYQSGKPKYWQPYAGGKKDGTLRWWFPNGALAGELEFAAGRRFGTGKVFYENGFEGFRADYAEDQLHGRMVWNDPSGRGLFSTSYVSGKAHGLLEIRHGGRTIAEARFHGGVVEGAVIVRNDKGLIVGEIPYQAGLLNGQVVLRDSTGAVRVSSAWQEGQLHGETEVWYASKAKASYCKFDDGHLTEWASFRPDASFRYIGKVTSIKDGRAIIEYFGGGPAAGVRCKTEDWNLEECESIYSGKVRPAPRLKDFVKSVASNNKLLFKPERCGGYSQSFDVSPFADLISGNVEIKFRVKDVCKDRGLATGLSCRASLARGNWSVEACEPRGDDEDEF